MTVPDVGPSRESWSGLSERAAARVTLAERCRQELARDLDELGLAAVLESWGITDESAKSRYGSGDVFSLAAEVRSMAPRRGDQQPAARLSVPLVRASWVVRAAAYVPPTVFVIIALSNAAVPASGAVFAAITCLGWGIGEAVSRVSYASIGRGGIEATRDSSRRILSWGTLMVVVISGGIGLISGSIGATLLIGAQLQYLLLSIVLLPMGREPVLLWWIAPAMLSAAYILPDESFLWVVLVVAVVGELAATLHTSVILELLDRTSYGAPGRREFRDAGPFLFAGVAMGAFVLSCTATALATLGSRQVLLVLVVPLMLSMGLAEIGIRRFQGVVVRELGRSTQLEEFARRARLMVTLFCASYVVALAAVDVLVAAVTDVQPVAGQPVAYVLLGLVGLALFLTLVLMVMDHVLPVLGAFVVGTVLIGGLVVPSGASEDAMALAVAVAASVVGYLFAMAVRVVGHPANHAFV